MLGLFKRNQTVEIDLGRYILVLGWINLGLYCTANWSLIPLISKGRKKTFKTSLQPVYYVNGHKPYKKYMQEYKYKYLYKFYLTKNILTLKNVNDCKKVAISK